MRRPDKGCPQSARIGGEDTGYRNRMAGWGFKRGMFKQKTWRDGLARFGTLHAVGLDGLAAGFAASGGEGNFGQTLRAGFAGGCLRPLDALQQLLCGQHEEEVDDPGEDEEVDAGRDEAAIFDGGSVDVEDKGGEVRLAHDSADERADDVTDERFSYIGKGCTNNKCDGKIHHIAAKDEIAKAFNHFWSPWCSR